MKWANPFKLLGKFKTKGVYVLVFGILLLIIAALPAAESQSSQRVEPFKEVDTMIKMQIIVGEQIFFAKLHNNKSTQALIKQLPMTITMEELNGNEKFYYFADSLPTEAYRPAEIRAGDLMLYGSKCMVLFYESLPNFYSYTKLGFVEDATKLAKALGNDKIQVTFLIP